MSSTGKCGYCHSTLAGHNNGAINVNPNGAGLCGGNFTFTGTTTGKNVTCSNVSCHSGKKTPNWW